MIKEVREIYRTRVMMQPFAGNYSNDKLFKNTGHLCWCMVKREEECHLLSGACPVYADIHKEFTDLDSDDQLVSYFKMVLARCDLIDDMM